MFVSKKGNYFQNITEGPLDLPTKRMQRLKNLYPTEPRCQNYVVIKMNKNSSTRPKKTKLIQALASFVVEIY